MMKSSPTKSPRKLLGKMLFASPVLRPKSSNASLAESNGPDYEPFEDLLALENIPAELREKLRAMDPHIKRTMVKSSSPRSSSSLGKHSRHRSMAALLSPSKKSRYDASLMSEPQPLEPSGFVHHLRSQTDSEILTQTAASLKLLLRRERVSWSDTFIDQGGLSQLAKLVSDLCNKEWRNDQDDNLLQQLLGCYQALCTVDRGRQALILDDRLLIMLIELLFSDKQPADYVTRTQIIKLLHQFVTIDAGCEAAMSLRALAMLQDQKQPELERPLDFLAAAHTPRPYNRWMKELDKPVRECFWIFLHDNSIPIVPMEELCEMEMRKPIVPQGYVGGVEWIVIEYICSHLQLINTMLRALASEKRNQLRVDLKRSHFEKTLNRLRRASQTYYEYLHEELMTWASLAHADGWSTDGVVGSEVSQSRRMHALQHDNKVASCIDSPSLPALDWS